MPPRGMPNSVWAGMSPAQRRMYMRNLQTQGSIEADENSTNVVDVQEPENDVPSNLWHVRPSGWWQNRDGRWIEISTMPDHYLTNVINFVERNRRRRPVSNGDVLYELRNEQRRREDERIQREQLQRVAADLDNWPRIRRGMYAGIDPRPFWAPFNGQEPQPEPEPPLPDLPRRIKE